MATIVQDSYTGPDGTHIEAHVGELGATNTLSTGGGDAGAFVLDTGQVRRCTFAEGGGLSAGERAFYASGVPPVDGVALQASITFASTSDNAYFAFVELADTGAYNDLVEFSQGSGFLPDGVHNAVVFAPSSGYDGGTVVVSPGVPILVRLEIGGGFFTLFADGAQVAQAPIVSAPTLPLGIGIYDGAGIGNVSVDDFLIETIAPAGAFWTRYVRTEEIIA